MLKKDLATGRTLYPICGWNANQHKLYHALVKAENAATDAIDSDDYNAMEKADNRVSRLNDLISLFDGGVDNDSGLVFMPYPEGQEVKDIINEYNATHAY